MVGNEVLHKVFVLLETEQLDEIKEKRNDIHGSLFCLLIFNFSILNGFVLALFARFSFRNINEKFCFCMIFSGPYILSFIELVSVTCQKQIH